MIFFTHQSFEGVYERLNSNPFSKHVYLPQITKKLCQLCLQDKNKEIVGEETTGLGFIFSPRISSANRVDLGFFYSINFPILSPPP